LLTSGLLGFPFTLGLESGLLLGFRCYLFVFFVKAYWDLRFLEAFAASGESLLTIFSASNWLSLSNWLDFLLFLDFDHWCGNLHCFLLFSGLLSIC